MTDFDERGRPEPPMAGDELATLTGFLDFHRATLEWKVSGLDAAGLAVTAGTSAMTLGGLVKHLALVERSWFAEFLDGGAAGEPWDSVDWDADRDWEWRTAAGDTPQQLLDLWRGAVGQSRALTEAALARGGLDQLARKSFRDGRAVSLRWILVHMIEEYSRHNGHADLLREAADGQTGE